MLVNENEKKNQAVTHIGHLIRGIKKWQAIK